MNAAESVTPYALLKKAEKMSYQEYRERIAAQDDTGPPDDEKAVSYRKYTSLNIQRMSRLDKTTKPTERIKEVVGGLQREYLVTTLTEGWCGDAAQNIPVLEKIAELSDKIETSYVLRDQHLELMDEFLTGGGRAIPKAIIQDKETGNIVATWGPRPEAAQRMVAEYKALNEEDRQAYSEFVVEVQKWYAKDRTQSFQAEWAALLGHLEG